MNETLTMAIPTSRLAIIVILAIVGFYFLVDHVDPLPLNHEAVGLGKIHLAHAVFGTFLIVGALFIWRQSRIPRSKTQSVTTPTSP